VQELATGAVPAVEALVRWRDPHAGLIQPSGFVPHAEDTGLIGRVGTWVMDAVCRQAAAWEADGIAPLVAFNVSPRELRADGWVDRLVRAMDEHGVEPARLVVEVSEAALDDPVRTLPVLEDLHGVGVRLALDDFGTCEASLTRLRDLPMDLMKIDRAFLRGVPEDPRAGAIVDAIAALARGLGMGVVAEGIETAAQLRHVRAAGCAFGQGFHLARPLPAAEATALLTSSRARSLPAAPASGRAPAAWPRT
jgi:EAL domain-containing protein (putative c-di-GMP-specific phosphodiesterase class I)